MFTKTPSENPPSVWMQSQKTNFILNFASVFFLFSAFLHEKLWKIMYWLVVGVGSTQKLLEISNIYQIWATLFNLETKYKIKFDKNILSWLPVFAPLPKLRPGRLPLSPHPSYDPEHCKEERGWCTKFLTFVGEWSAVDLFCVSTVSVSLATHFFEKH